MENNPLSGLFGVSSPHPEPQLIAPQPTTPTENIEYEIPLGRVEQLLANHYCRMLLTRHYDQRPFEKLCAMQGIWFSSINCLG